MSYSSCEICTVYNCSVLNRSTSNGDMPSCNGHVMASAVAVGLSNTCKDNCETAPAITTTSDDTTEPHVGENENSREADCDHGQLPR